jgi:O-antigen/teichoic acid export membrane protein
VIARDKDVVAESSVADAASSSAGRGVLYIAFAKFYFMIAGAILEFRLPALLANTVFGAYAVVSSAVSPFNNVLVTGSIQAVSRFTAQKPALARTVQATGLRMHLFVGLPVALFFIAVAPLVAYLLHDPGKTGPLMLAGGIIAGYSFYAVFVGTANGLRLFHKQAALDISFATLRVLAILGLVTAGFGLYGALGGWVGATAAILLAATLVVGMPGKAGSVERVPVRPMVKYFAGVATYLILLNLIMFIDQLLLKRMVTEWFHTHAAVLTDAARSHFGWTTAAIGWDYDASQMATTGRCRTWPACPTRQS